MQVRHVAKARRDDGASISLIAWGRRAGTVRSASALGAERLHAATPSRFIRSRDTIDFRFRASTVAPAAQRCDHVLVNPKNPNAADAKTFEAAGKTLGVEIVIVQASTQAELIEAFTQAEQHRADALVVHVDALFNDVGETQIVVLAAQHRLPTMMANSDFPARGGLISYGPDTKDLNRQAGHYVARILRGEKPADLPVLQPATFPLRVNLRTAMALGLSIPESFLLLADEVIE